MKGYKWVWSKLRYSRLIIYSKSRSHSIMRYTSLPVVDYRRDDRVEIERAVVSMDLKSKLALRSLRSKSVLSFSFRSMNSMNIWFFIVVVPLKNRS